VSRTTPPAPAGGASSRKFCLAWLLVSAILSFFAQGQVRNEKERATGSPAAIECGPRVLWTKTFHRAPPVLGRSVCNLAEIKLSLYSLNRKELPTFYPVRYKSMTYAAAASNGGILLGVPVKLKIKEGTSHTALPQNGLLLLKLDSDGNLEWSREIVPDAGLGARGRIFTYFALLEQPDPLEGRAFYVLASEHPGPKDMRNARTTGGDFLILKISHTGKVIWKLSEGGVAAIPFWLHVLEDGSIVVAGTAFRRISGNETRVFRETYLVMWADPKGKKRPSKEFDTWNELVAFCASRPWGRDFWSLSRRVGGFEALEPVLGRDGYWGWFFRIPKWLTIKELPHGGVIVAEWKRTFDGGAHLECFGTDVAGNPEWHRVFFAEESPPVCNFDSVALVEVLESGKTVLLAKPNILGQTAREVKLIGLDAQGEACWTLELGKAESADMVLASGNALFVVCCINNQVRVKKIALTELR